MDQHGDTDVYMTHIEHRPKGSNKSLIDLKYSKTMPSSIVSINNYGLKPFCQTTLQATYQFVGKLAGLDIIILYLNKTQIKNTQISLDQKHQY